MEDLNAFLMFLGPSKLMQC